MKCYCPDCEMETEHRGGKGFILDGNCLDFADDRVKCIPCVRIAVEACRAACKADDAKPPPAGADNDDIVMHYGKHKGKTVGRIAEIDLPYLHWLAATELSHGLQQAVWHLCARNPLP